MKTLRIHYFQHVPFEGLGCIEPWVIEKGHTLTATAFYNTSYQLPELQNIDWLIIMGGPMSVQDVAEYPWLKEEKTFIKQAIQARKTIIGICLGAQLVAEALGARVYPNAQKEIGWFKVTRTTQGTTTALLKDLEPSFTVFHWHGDTFDLPKGAEHLMQSEACLNQMFLYRNYVLGIQFHFEATVDTLHATSRHGKDELTPGKYIQSEEYILAQEKLIRDNNQRMYAILSKLEHVTLHGVLKKFAPVP